MIRNVVTLVHEAGHAVIATLAGRRLSGISLHSDTSGVTVSSGKPYGLGLIFTAYAGYVAAPTVGLGLVATIEAGRAVASAWVVLALLAVLLLLIRNFHGLLVTGATIVVAAGLVLWAPVVVGVTALVGTAWFLMFAGFKTSRELRALHRRGEGHGSDAHQLALLTPLPASFWVWSMNVWNLACIAVAGTLVFR